LGYGKNKTNLKALITMCLKRQKTRPVARTFVNPGTGIGNVKITGRLVFCA
jgi:hypothetical protein